MKVILFNQWDKLSSLIKNTSLAALSEKTSYAIKNLAIENNAVTLSDRAMNNLTLTGEAVTVKVPDIIPGKARDFLLRVEASLDTEIKFSGAEAFEGDHPDVLMPPAAGETIVYFFTETKADVFLVARRKVVVAGV